MPTNDSGVPFSRFIRSAADLVTSRDATREGFIIQALAKSGDKASPYVRRSKILLTALQSGTPIETLLGGSSHRSELIAAAGFSIKAGKYFGVDELDNRVKEILTVIISEAGSEWADEIVFRYLLTKGDAIGGEMRNWIGANAHRKLSGALKEFLPSQGVLETVNSKTGKLQRVDWGSRRIHFDIKPKFIGNNIDIVLLDARPLANEPTSRRSIAELVETPEAYLACGELKGGIDPAGADEHWKTAKGALDRIRVRFRNLDIPTPKLFFVGAAIESKMGEEIFGYLRDGTLNYAANLTVPDQLSDLAQWLVSL